jgi:DNA invertase Pin-like site-specific DNA recombinase
MNRGENGSFDRGNGKVSEFRAAQYVRMSTEHQKYSTHNQADKIREYADKRGIEIVRIYAKNGTVCSLGVIEKILSFW